LSGFVDEQGEALGRPVGVAIDKTGALLVADDIGNTVWRVTRDLVRNAWRCRAGRAAAISGRPVLTATIAVISGS
jgi:hypothetical protein